MAGKSKCSNDSQKITPGIWYYENPGSIDLVINRKWFETHADYQGLIVKISRRKLAASVERMTASLRKIRGIR